MDSYDSLEFPVQYDAILTCEVAVNGLDVRSVFVLALGQRVPHDVGYMLHQRPNRHPVPGRVSRGGQQDGVTETLDD